MAHNLKVLTFGWEFPPHISGGLGTACYGLTKSLLRQGTKVLFVVPRTYGDEEIDLISGSDILIPSGELPAKGPVGAKERLYTPSAEQALVVVPVRSEIQPYTSPETALTSGISTWNYALAGHETPASDHLSAPSGKRYIFSGAYGPGLIEEVLRYGAVGAVIGAEYDFDIIHSHDWLTFPAGIAAKKASSKPLVIHVHATEYDRAASHNVNPSVVEIEQQGMQEADLIVAVSEWTRQILISKYGVSAEKISVVHNGILLEKGTQSAKKSRRRQAWPMVRQMVTFLGRVTYQKGPGYFVDAARIVLDKFPDTHFVMAGSGDLLPAMVERVAALKLSSQFHFTGFLRREQVEEVWALSDVYVMPSVSEPFGIAPLEAIQSGVPVIVSNQSGVSEVMPHVIKADFWDVEGLAGAICSVLKHKSLRTTLRKQSKTKLKEITWGEAARKLTRLFHETRSKSN